MTNPENDGMVGRCAHFNGIGIFTDRNTKTCAAGMVYREVVGGPTDGWCTRLPCLATLNGRVVLPVNGNIVTCPKFQEVPVKPPVAKVKGKGRR